MYEVLKDFITGVLVKQQWDHCLTADTAVYAHWKVHKWDRYSECIVSMLIDERAIRHNIPDYFVRVLGHYSPQCSDK